jgi:glutamine synthetase
VAEVAYLGTKAEFFIFDDIRFDQNEHEGYYFMDSVEDPNLGYKPRYKEGYFPVTPPDSMQYIQSEMLLNLEKIGEPVEAQHHEVATGGQAENDMCFAPLVQMADSLLKYKYVIKNTARKNNKTVTFIPKPFFNDYDLLTVNLSFSFRSTSFLGGYPMKRPLKMCAPRS